MLKEILKDKGALISIVLAVIFLISSFLILILNIQSSGLSYVIHYKAIGGIDLFGSWRDVYYLIFAGILIFIINLFIANLLWQRSKELAYFTIFSLPVLQVFLLTSSISLVYINR